MLGEIRVERRATLHAGAIMRHDFVQSLEPAVVHVGRGERHVAQRRHGELAGVRRMAGDFLPAQIGECAVESVVGKTLALEQRPAVAMKTIGSVLPAPWIVFGVEQFKSTLFLRREFLLAAQDPVKLGVKRRERE